MDGWSSLLMNTNPLHSHHLPIRMHASHLGSHRLLSWQYATSPHSTDKRGYTRLTEIHVSQPGGRSPPHGQTNELPNSSQADG